jgi:ribosomal protein L37AE/L43A
MAQTVQRVEDEYGLVLRRYLGALAREGRPQRMVPSPGHQIRTCPECGRQAAFSLEPEGIWFRCSACGHYA